MDRRLFLLATAAMLGGGALPAAAAAPKSFILLVMARDCPWCMDWNAHDRATFDRLCRQSGAPVREVEVMRYSDIREASAWPEDLKPVLAQIRQTTGTPRFIIVRDGKIIQHAVGRRQYELGILPFIS